jgi:tetratricopeptide (TPR) repeat protein
MLLVIPKEAMTSRIDQLKQFAQEDPKDPFNKYALALEYQKTEAKMALEIFEQLVIDHRDYVPTYYHLGKLYQEYGRTRDALQVFDTGISEARKQNDTKAMNELQTAYREAQFESSDD